MCRRLDSLAAARYIAGMATNPSLNWPFMKMHGLGNDFVVIDARARNFNLSPALITAVGDRHRGVGFDQLAVISQGATRPHLTFYNADGTVSAACGNATRCVAQYLMAESGEASIQLTTERGILAAHEVSDGMTSVNMGHPQFRWDEVPLSEAMETDALPIEGRPVATGMGNPHCTFFVDDLSQVDLTQRGGAIEHHPLFPERTNVQFAQLVGPDHLRMRVWERGVGVTMASGSSSCATAVAAARRGLTGRRVQVDLDGGKLMIDWREDGVWMTGPSAHVFSGTLTASFLDSLI